MFFFFRSIDLYRGRSAFIFTRSSNANIFVVMIDDWHRNGKWKKGVRTCYVLFFTDFLFFVFSIRGRWVTHQYHSMVYMITTLNAMQTTKRTSTSTAQRNRLIEIKWKWMRLTHADALAASSVDIENRHMVAPANSTLSINLATHVSTMIQ